MQQLPWNLISVPSDGRCAIHATAVACGFKVCEDIQSELLKYYEDTPSQKLIQDLITSGDFCNDTNIKEFGDAHIANPLNFADFIKEKSPWVNQVLTFECSNATEIGLTARHTCPHQKVLAFVHKRANRHLDTTHLVNERKTVIFLNANFHWFVLLPIEQATGSITNIPCL